MCTIKVRYLIYLCPYKTVLALHMITLLLHNYNKNILIGNRSKPITIAMTKHVERRRGIHVLIPVLSIPRGSTEGVTILDMYHPLCFLLWLTKDIISCIIKNSRYSESFQGPRKNTCHSESSLQGSEAASKYFMFFNVNSNFARKNNFV